MQITYGGETVLIKSGKKWRWITGAVCVILMLSIGGWMIHKGDYSAIMSRRQDQADVSDMSSDHTDKAELTEEAQSSGQDVLERGFEDFGQQNILSDGAYLYTIHNQRNGKGLARIFAVETSGVRQVWTTTVESNARMEVDRGKLTIVCPEKRTHEWVWDVSDPCAPVKIAAGQQEETEGDGEASQAGENAAKRESDAPDIAAEQRTDPSAVTREYPFGADLTLRLEVESSQKKRVKVRLVMLRTSTGEALHTKALVIGDRDWLTRLPDNIMVDHQHSYIGIGCRSKRGHSLYRLYYYNEAAGFQKEMGYDWGVADIAAESCGWIRGNEVYVFSPDGSQAAVYDAVSGEWSR